MGELDPNKASVTSLNSLKGYSVGSQPLDFSGSQKETYWYFTKAAEYFGYYKKIPELKKSVDALALWTAGRGYTTQDSLTKVTLDFVSGWGEDSIDSIFENMLIVKKIIGDSFAEIIEDQETELLINLKPISPERVRIVVDENGITIRYDIMKDNVWKPIKKRCYI
jgi:hypothetical protein